MRPALVLLALVTSCAAPQKLWMKTGAGEQEFNADAGQCKAQGFGVPGAMYNTTQVAIVYNSCMQGKGWQLTDQPAQSAGAAENNPNYIILKR